MNCGYARTAICELSSSQRGIIDKTKREQQFRELFDLPTFKLKDDLFTSPNPELHLPAPFDRYCERINACFSKKWHPSSKRVEYLDMFSMARWKDLPELAKVTHTMGYCTACYNAYPTLQAAFPEKPVYEHHKIVSLPAFSSEREFARNVLAELNHTWENRFSRTFTEAIPKVVPECNFVQKKGKMEKKNEEQAQKRKLVSEINEHFSQNATMSVLAEAESLASNGCKRLSLSYEQPTTPKRRKSHSPKEDNMTWMWVGQ